MNIEGFNKVTLLDFPEHVACTVFTGGCDYRCPFCHNSPLVFHPNANPISEEEILSYLKKRVGVLDGVAITGGEPLIHKDIGSFIRKLKDLGFKVKLDTNGNHPELLSELLSEKLVDYVAMDIKNSPARYAETVGIENFDLSNVRKSMSLIMNGEAEYEFRTTAVREFHDADSFKEIAKFIKGAEKYYIQNFVDSGALICEGLHGFEEKELREFEAIVKDAAKVVGVRGI